MAPLVLALLGGCHTSPAPPGTAPPIDASSPTGAPPRGTASAPPGQPAAAGLFTDASKEAGLNYRWEVHDKRPLNILQTIGNGCAFLDYDNDGNLDILLVGPKPALYHGDGRGRFTDVTASVLGPLAGHYLGCAVGDYDNDGYPDLYISGYRTGSLLHNEKGQRYRDVTAAAGIPPQRWGTSCAFADLDNDGKLDLYIGNYVIFGPDSRQLCDFSGIQSSCGPRFYPAEQGRLYRNLGGGRFSDITRAWGGQAVTGKALGVAIADFDDSGRQSIAIANDEVPGDLLRNLGGKFRNDAVSAGTAFDRDGNVHGGMGIDWGDYNNDGKLDLVVGTFQREPKSVYRNEGKGVFDETSTSLGVAEHTMPYVAFGVKWFDYDNDGWLDLIFANGHVQDNIEQIDKSTYRQPTQLFHSQQAQSFDDVSAQGGAAFQKRIVGRGLAVGDYDNDGKLDVLVVDSEGEPLLLHNRAPSAGHWLSVRLQGVKSNRDGIGALVTVETGGLKQVRRCATDGSYMSASDRRVHFGLGATSGPVTVTVRWPGGRKTVHQNVPIDRVVALKER